MNDKIDITSIQLKQLFQRKSDSPLRSWPLNDVQEAAKKRILNSIATGEYTVEEIDTCMCGGKGIVDVCEMDRAELPFGVKLCCDCGLLFTSPRLSKASLPKFYERDYHHLVFGTYKPDTSFAAVSSDQGYKIYHRILPFFPEDNRNISILEVGCAGGQVLLQIEQIGKKNNQDLCLTGTEYNQELVESLQKTGIEAYQGSVEPLKKAKKKFDFIILSHVLEHVAEIDEFLKDISQLMHKTSILYVEVPGVLSLDSHDGVCSAYKKDFLLYFTCAHMWHFSLETLKSIMAQNNFRLLEGNEEICSVFQLGQHKTFQPSKAHALKVLKFLISLEEKRILDSPSKLEGLLIQFKRVCKRGLAKVRKIAHS